MVKMYKFLKIIKNEVGIMKINVLYIDIGVSVYNQIYFPFHKRLHPSTKNASTSILGLISRAY
jgi:hypothetical protein